MRYGQILLEILVIFMQKSRKLWSNYFTLTSAITGFVENDQKTESFSRGNTIYFLYYFPKERPGALISIRRGLNESTKT